MIRQNRFYHWIKLQRRYRSAQAKWAEKQDTRTARRVDILSRRLHTLNLKWKLGIAIPALSAWLAMIPAKESLAQGNVFPATIELPSLTGSSGFMVEGAAVDTRSGQSVSNAGDVNGDGIDDFIIGASKTGGFIGGYYGASYVVFGKTGGFTSPVELSALDGNNGFRIKGASTRDYSGFSVSNAGDVNGDGIDDVIIGARRPRQDSAPGVSHVVFGSRDGFAADIELASLDGSNGFTINGVVRRDELGFSVCNAGDVNNDGIGDMILGAPASFDGNSGYDGTVYVVFGSNSRVDATVDLSLLDGNDGFRINGEGSRTRFGHSVSGLRDVNGDGIDDIIIGEPNPGSGNTGGMSYVIFGKRSGFQPTMQTSSLDGSNGFAVEGKSPFFRLGFSVSEAGDMNGDGLNDIVIAAPYQSGYGSLSGECYVIFGRNENFPSSLDLEVLDGNLEEGFTIRGPYNLQDQGERSNYSVSSAGDINGDGLNDIILGASGIESYDDKSGSSYVVFGSKREFISPLDVRELDGVNGFILEGGFYDRSGGSVSLAGDVNGDGVDDVIIGATGANNEAGAGYVIFGRDQTAEAPFVNRLIRNSTILLGQSFNFTIPANTFSDPNMDDVLTLAATLENGDALPAWLTFDPNTNTFTGTPSDSDLGKISVRVTATDESAQSVSDDFDIDVIINTPPVLPSIGPISGLVGENITFDAAAVDNDVPADRLNYRLDNISSGKGMFINFTTGAFSWRPASSQSGSHEVTITVNDRFFTDSEVVTILVDFPNRAPVLSIIEPKNGEEDSEISFTVEATDPDGDALTYSLDATSMAKGMRLDEATGEFLWTPSELQQGTHEVTVSVSDGTLTTTEIVTITVNEVNVAPVLTSLEEQIGDEGTTFTFTAAAVDEDIPVNTLVFQLDDTSRDKGMIIDETTGEFRWTPSEAQDGTHEVTVSVSDGISITSEIVIVTVNEVNVAPILTAFETQIGDEGTAIAFTAEAVDEDIPANTLVFRLDDTSQGKGMIIDEATGEFLWTPSELQQGTHEVTVSVSDGTLTTTEIVTITVNEVNVAPVLTSLEEQIGDEGTTFAFTAEAVDEDIPVNTLLFQLDDTSRDKGMTIDETTGEFRWTPSEAQDGTHEVTVSVSDGISITSEIVMVTVNEVNVAPVLTAFEAQNGDEGTAITFTAEAVDEDIPANTLTFLLDNASVAKGMGLDEATGRFNWTPSEAQDGTHQATITVNDGEFAASEVVTITVNEVNTMPVLEEIEAQSGDEGTQISFEASATDTDLPANTLVFSLDAASLAKGMTIDEVSGSFSWTPEVAQIGTHEVTVEVSDGISTVSQTVIITVNDIITALEEGINPVIRIYPNPVEDHFQLVVTNPYIGKVDINITDLQGHYLLQQESIKQNEQLEIRLDVSHFNAGIYLVEIKGEGNNPLVKRRIMKR